LVGGTYIDVVGKRSRLGYIKYVSFKNPYSYALDLQIDSRNWLNMVYTEKEIGDYGKNCRRTNSTHNFFMARKETLLKVPWRSKLKMNEHEFFFLDLGMRHRYGIVECPQVTVLHNMFPRSLTYSSSSSRYTEFCRAFKMLCREYNSFRGFRTPWVQADCEEQTACVLLGASNRKEMADENGPWSRATRCTSFLSPSCDL